MDKTEKGQRQNQGKNQGEIPAPQLDVSVSGDVGDTAMLQKILTGLPSWMDLSQMQKILTELQSRDNLTMIRNVLANIPPFFKSFKINDVKALLPNFLKGLPGESRSAIQSILDDVPPETNLAQLQTQLEMVPLEMDPALILQLLKKLLETLPPGTSLAQIQQALALLPPGLDLPKILQSLPRGMGLLKISELLQKIPSGIDLQTIRNRLESLPSETDSALSKIKAMLEGLEGVDLSQIKNILVALTTPGGCQSESEKEGMERQDTSDAFSDPLKEIIDAAKKKAADSKDPRSDGMCTLIILDTSGSMAGYAMLEAQTFISDFLDGLEEIKNKFKLTENVALGTFGQGTQIIQHLTNEYSHIRSEVGCLLAEGPSSMELGIVLPLGTFSQDQPERCIAETNGHKVLPRVIIISDGYPSITPDVQDVAPTSTEETQMLQDIVIELTEALINKVQYTVYCVHVGKDPQTDFLTALSNNTGGKLIKPVDGERASRCYLHHYLASKVISDGGQEQVRDDIYKLFKQVVQAEPNKEDADCVLEIINKWKEAREAGGPREQHDTLGDIKPEECMHLLNQMLGREPVETKTEEADPMQLLELLNDLVGAFEDPTAGGPGRGVVGSPIEVLKQRNDGGRIGLPANPLKMLKTRLDVGVE